MLAENTVNLSYDPGLVPHDGKRELTLAIGL